MNQTPSGGGRLFVAIDLPEYVKETIGQFQESVGQVEGFSWVAPEKLHLTLAFLGEVGAEVQEEVIRRLPEARVDPFFLALEGLGVFPRKGRPQVLWAGMAPVDPRLFQLHGKVERVLMDLGFEPEKRRYHPHVTLARCGGRAAGAVQAVLKRHADFGAAPFKVERVTLFASQLRREGAVYTRLAEVEF